MYEVDTKDVRGKFFVFGYYALAGIWAEHAFSSTVTGKEWYISAGYAGIAILAAAMGTNQLKDCIEIYVIEHIKKQYLKVVSDD